MALTDPATIQDRDILGADGGKLGKVETVFLDAQTDKPEWAAISTGFFGRKVSLVPLSAATETRDGNLQVPFDKERVKGSPHHEPDQALSSRTRSSSSSTTASPGAARPSQRLAPRRARPPAVASPTSSAPAGRPAALGTTYPARTRTTR